MTAVLSPPGVSGLAHARDAVGAAASEPLWSLTDRELAVQVGHALALRAQADAVLLARLSEVHLSQAEVIADSHKDLSTEVSPVQRPKARRR